MPPAEIPRPWFKVGSAADLTAGTPGFGASPRTCCSGPTAVPDPVRLERFPHRTPPGPDPCHRCAKQRWRRPEGEEDDAFEVAAVYRQRLRRLAGRLQCQCVRELQLRHAAGQALARLAQQQAGGRAQQQELAGRLAGTTALIDHAAQDGEQLGQALHLVENHQAIALAVQEGFWVIELALGGRQFEIEVQGIGASRGFGEGEGCAG